MKNHANPEDVPIALPHLVTDSHFTLFVFVSYSMYGIPPFICHWQRSSAVPSGNRELMHKKSIPFHGLFVSKE